MEAAAMNQKDHGIGVGLRSEFAAIAHERFPRSWKVFLERMKLRARRNGNIATETFFMDPLEIEEACAGIERLGLLASDFEFSGYDERVRVVCTSTGAFREYPMHSAGKWWDQFLRDLQAGAFSS
jgi:hypothetical protein